MFDRFQHYLSYGSTDQQTVRDLSGLYNGLLVPGTIAAFQSEGTKGFVLSLSASSSVPYVIDSRFPLFQNRLPDPKKSHVMLAEILGVPELVRTDREPAPGDLSAAMLGQIALSWIEFNIGFEDVQSKTFEKYAARLGEPVLTKDRQKPEFILPPYAMVSQREDGWWEVSEALWQQSRFAAGERDVEDKLRRVVAARTPLVLHQLLAEVQEAEVVEWVSDLDEFRPNSEQKLIDYANALRGGMARGQRLFALYGGFFSILMARYGLVGSSHGIGFGEHRDWVELPSSGAPPARYYVPRLHRYIGVDIAVEIWRQYPDLISCDCTECNSGSPGNLDYHALMKHSVRVRNREVIEWLDLSTVEVQARLDSDFMAFRTAVESLVVTERTRRRVEDIHLHLAMWSRVLGAV